MLSVRRLISLGQAAGALPAAVGAESFTHIHTCKQLLDLAARTKAPKASKRAGPQRMFQYAHCLVKLCAWHLDISGQPGRHLLATDCLRFLAGIKSAWSRERKQVTARAFQRRTQLPGHSEFLSAAELAQLSTYVQRQLDCIADEPRTSEAAWRYQMHLLVLLHTGKQTSPLARCGCLLTCSRVTDMVPQRRQVYVSWTFGEKGNVVITADRVTYTHIPIPGQFKTTQRVVVYELPKSVATRFVCFARQLRPLLRPSA